MALVSCLRLVGKEGLNEMVKIVEQCYGFLLPPSNAVAIVLLIVDVVAVEALAASGFQSCASFSFRDLGNMGIQR